MCIYCELIREVLYWNMLKIIREEAIRIAITDDHLILRQTVQKMLSREPRFEVVITAENGADLINQLREKSVDIVIFDIEMPIMNGRETLGMLNKLYPEIKTLILSMHDDSVRIKKYFHLGAKGFLTKVCEYKELVLALETIAEGRVYLNSLSTHKAYREAHNSDHKRNKIIIDEPLTARELEILKLVCLEKSNKEIAAELDISHRTIENHTLRIRKKTGAVNGVGLLVYAVKNKIVEF